MRHIGVSALALVVGGLLIASAAHAGQSTGGTVKGQVSGQIRSGSADVINIPVTVLSVPSDRVFVMTQACIAGPFGISLHSQALGKIATEGDYGSWCTSYTPGIVLPAADVLSCVAEFFSSQPGTCTVTGVLSRK